MIQNLLIKFFLLMVVLSVNGFAGGFTVDYGSGWIGTGAANGTIKNTTSTPWFIKGYRANINVPPSALTAYGNLTTPVKVDDGNAKAGEQRWEFVLSGAANNNNFLGNGGSNGITVTPGGLKWDDKSTLWTPNKEQWLVKVGSFGTKKSFYDIKEFDLDSLRILVNQPWFYNSNLYVPDTVMGDRGGPASGGVINTWCDQDADTALWQVQMCRTDPFIQNGGDAAPKAYWNPLVMGSQNPAWGAGPLYAMSLAMVTEYFNLDYQLMAASATNESEAGLEPESSLGGSRYNTANTDLWMGTNHWEEPTYRDVIWGGYPKYFPEDPSSSHSTKYANSVPVSSNICVGNSAQMANVQLINAVYYWYSYELLYNSTEFYADYAFRNAADKEIASKLFLAMWNGGRNSQDSFLSQLGSNPTAILSDPDLDWSVFGNDYIRKIYKAITPMQEGSLNSVANGGANIIYDHKITRDNVQAFFFGEAGIGYGGSTEIVDPSNGILGAGGLLHHFSLNSNERIAIWEKLMEAFDILVATGPYGSDDAISLRYEWLALMRIVKGDLDLSMPTPTNSDFVTWTKGHSSTSVIEDNGGPTVENNYPFLVEQGRVVANDTVSYTYNLTDETYLDIDSIPTFEWTVDGNWGKWQKGTLISGNTLSAQYAIALSSDEVKEIAFNENGDSNSVVKAWVRGYDRNYNAVIDTLSIFWDIPKQPTLDSAEANDTDGDGMADEVKVYLTKSIAVGADDLNSITNLEWSWPNTSPMNSSTTKPNSGVITITDASITSGSGQGRVTFDYPSAINKYDGSVADKVGPALSSAKIDTKLAGRTEDILILKVTEDLISSINGDSKAYLAFSSDSGKTDSTLIVATSFEYVSKDSVKVILPLNTISSTINNWVRLVSNSAVEDLANNGAQTNSIWIEIEIASSGSSFKSATISDTKGDGIGDSVTVAINSGTESGSIDLSSINSVIYNWTTSSSPITLTSSDFTTNTTNDSLVFKVNTGVNSFGSGKGYVKLLLADGSVQFEGAIDDKTGPAVVNADLNISDPARSSDKLVLSASESLDAIFTTDSEYILFWQGTTTAPSIVSDSVVKVTDTTWEFHFATGGIASMDSVKFNPSTGVVDLVSNVPLAFNQWVKINVTGSATNIKSAGAFDKNDGNGADGTADSVMVSLSVGTAVDAFTTADIKNGTIQYRWNSSVTTQSPSTITIVDDSTFYFPIDVTLFKFGSGTGEVSVQFNDESLLTATIDDKTGPAILTAQRLFSEIGEDDTVLVTISEKLSNSFSADGVYFSIKDVISASDMKSKSVMAVNDSTLRIVFVNSVIQIVEGQFISFVASSDVKDGALNSANPLNQYIPITIIGGKTPGVVRSEMFDHDGNGRADSIVTVLKLGSHESPFTVDSITDAKYSWPTDHNLTSGAIRTTVDDTIFTMTGISIDTTYGTGKIEMTFPNGTVVLFAITDKVGPVILKALLWENLGGQDTLQVHFSEDVTSITAAQALLNVENIPEISPEAISYKANPRVWLFSFANNTVQVGDSVNILKASGLTDSKGNLAHDSNIKVEVQEIRRPIGVIADECGYFDTNADGKMDQVQIKLISAVDSARISEFKVSFTWPTDAGLGVIDTVNITPTMFTADGSELITIDVSKENIMAGMTFVDGTFGELILLQPNDDTPDELHETPAFTPKDKMAPVLINAAQYRGKHLTSDESDFEDTLILNYSESVQQTNFSNSSTSFLFALKDMSNLGSSYSVDITKESIHSDQIVSYVVKVDPTISIIPGTGDSIQIAGSGDIKDNNGNIQMSVTPSVPFKTVVLPAEYEVIIYPNPFTIDTDVENELITKYGDGTDGTGKLAVMIRPYGNRVGENLQGWITTFDAVGNVIANGDEIPLMNSGVLLYTTDGKNESGRAIGSGSYRSIITVKSGSGENEQVNTIPAMIGIKKQK